MAGIHPRLLKLHYVNVQTLAYAVAEVFLQIIGNGTILQNGSIRLQTNTYKEKKGAC